MQKAKYLVITSLLLLGAGCAQSSIITSDTTPLSPKAIDLPQTSSYTLGPDIPKPTAITDKDKLTDTAVSLYDQTVKNHVTLSTVQTPTEGIVATLSVGTVKTVVPGGNPEGVFGIVDINIYDEQKEIAVTDLGPSSDLTTTFYAFDGKTLQNLGTVGGDWESMAFDGKGGFVTTVRAQVLDTWFHGEKWTLDGNNVLTSGTETFFNRTTPVTLRQTETFKKTPDNTATDAFTLKPGDKATVTGCNDVLNGWCVVEIPSGEQGWFQTGAYDTVDGQISGEIFDGLSFAD